MTWQLLQTERSYKLENKLKHTSVFTLIQTKKDLNLNKIELTKKLVKMGIKVSKITSTNFQQKSKKKGRHTILQFRPKKYFVVLEKGGLITEENINSLNEPVSLTSKISPKVQS